MKMSAFRYPSVFLSHGSPMHVFGEDHFSSMLESLSANLPKPKAIIFISAHSVSSETVHILKTNKNKIIHDFNGFPAELYEVQYQCNGDPTLADQISQLLIKSGFQLAWI
jgi:4,5-DOPA dioxygenase extradiol